MAGELDLEKFRWPDEDVARVGAAKAKADATPTSKPHTRRTHSHSKKRFTKVPWAWQEALGNAHYVSGSTWQVALCLLHEAWRLTSSGCKPVVKLTDTMLAPVNVGEKGKRAALRKLQELNLVTVEH